MVLGVRGDAGKDVEPLVLRHEVVCRAGRWPAQRCTRPAGCYCWPSCPDGSRGPDGAAIRCLMVWIEEPLDPDTVSQRFDRLVERTSRPESVQCTATIRSGERCRRTAPDGDRCPLQGGRCSIARMPRL
jgi:hypothetical protein